MSAPVTRVLVTGGSGFVGSHCLAQLIAQGHAVRTTVRSASRGDGLREALTRHGVDASGLEIFVADLSADDGWEEAAAGCSHVLHVASPFPARQPKDPDELIVPARDGALRVLAASRKAGVARVVMTSSFAAIGYGHESPAVRTEADWSDLAADLSPYVRSKTMAEKAAWDFVAKGGPELVVINPVAIVGPPLTDDISNSLRLVQALLKGMPLVDVSLGLVDVRDVATLHVQAMTNDRAVGRRFIATAGEPVSLPVIARWLRADLGPRAKWVPTITIPVSVLHGIARVIPPLRHQVKGIDTVRRASNAAAREVFGWTPIDPRRSIDETAESLLAMI